MGWKGGHQVPGQEFLKPVDRMFGDALQNMAQVEFRIKSVEFGLG